MSGALPRLLEQRVFVSAAHDQDLHVREIRDECRQRAEQNLHPLAGLVEAAQEQHRLSRSWVTR
jgi:hypothetical protein